jgi:hypothetical protein
MIRLTLRLCAVDTRTLTTKTEDHEERTKKIQKG